MSSRQLQLQEEYRELMLAAELSPEQVTRLVQLVEQLRLSSADYDADEAAVKALRASQAILGSINISQLRNEMTAAENNQREVERVTAPRLIADARRRAMQATKKFVHGGTADLAERAKIKQIKAGNPRLFPMA
jgi:hypothetical protein